MKAVELFEANIDIAMACRDHPFVLGIASGRLDLASFQHYVVQDAAFLDGFARAYALGLAKAPDREAMSTFKELLDGVLDELRLHAAYAERWGVVPGVGPVPAPAPATRAYTDFLLRVATLEPPAHLCAAMAPCMRLYAWLGSELRPQTDPSSPYREWVDTYAGPEFRQLATTLDALLDRLGGDAVVVADHYRTAMGLELAFFDAAHLRARG